MSINTERENVKGDIGRESIARVWKGRIKVKRGIGGLGGEHIDARLGNGVFVTTIDRDDKSKTEEHIDQVIGSENIDAQEIGDIEDIDGSILLSQGKEDEGAVGSFDQGLDEVVGTIEGF